MYIYEGHMGTLLASKEKLNYEQLYCEQCNDSDTFLGIANNRNELWELLKDKTSTFDERKCHNCIHDANCDYDYCDNHCEDYQHYGGWDYGFVMKFIYDVFPDEDNNMYFVLLGKHADCDDMLFINYDNYSLPICPTNNRNAFPILDSMCMCFESPEMDSLKYVGDIKIGNNTYICYSILTTELGKEWKETASNYDDSWWGYCEIEEIKEKTNNKKLLEKSLRLLKKRIKKSQDA